MRRVAIETLVCAMLERLRPDHLRGATGQPEVRLLTRPPAWWGDAGVAEVSGGFARNAQRTVLRGSSESQGSGSSNASNAMKSPGGGHQARGSIAMWTG